VSGPRLLDLNAEIDRLYQGPLAEFTAARNALAARVKAEQGKDAAQHIKTLEKPNVTAWIVNQLVWRHRADFTALLLAGDAVRLVQQQRLGGAAVDVAPATRARQIAMDTLVAHAADLVKELGQEPSVEIRQRLVSTLDALATYGTGDSPQRAGRLTRDVSPPGFSELAALLPAVPAPGAAPNGPSAPRPASPKLTVVARRDRERARSMLAGAQATLDGAKTRDALAREAMATAEAAWQAAKRAVAEAQQALDRAAAQEGLAVAERDQRKRDAARAALDVRDAEKAVVAATRALDD
jgi:hypothetical protein